MTAIGKAKVRTRWQRWPYRKFIWRPGPWLFAFHPIFSWLPRLDIHNGPAVRGASLWWLWFEVACVWDRRA